MVARHAIKKLTRGDKNIQWIESYCRIPEGKFVGEKVKLVQFQKDIIKGIYDTPTRRAIISYGRKNAKTTLSAFLLLLHLCGPEAKANASAYSAAQSRDQAAILFSLAAKIVRMSPELSSYVGIRDTAKQLFCSELGTLYRALSAESSTAFGLSPSFICHDELGQVRGPRSELYEALETASAAQSDPLSIVISTQAATDQDLLSLLIDDALTNADPKQKVWLYTAPLDCDLTSEDSIRSANPAYDFFMNKEEVLAQAQNAVRMPSREQSFRNLILNMRVEASAPFIPRSVWEANGERPNLVAGSKMWFGLDLSSVNDLTALVGVDNRGNVSANFWLPEYGLAEKARQDKVPYDLWAREGFLNLTPGKSIEYEFVADFMRGLFDTYDVQAVGFDRYNMKFLKPWLIKSDFSDDELERFIEFGQGTASMTPALRELESMLLNQKLKHGNHPIMNMCCANAKITGDSGARKFDKKTTRGRIDGMVALAMAVGVMPSEAETQKSFWEAQA